MANIDVIGAGLDNWFDGDKSLWTQSTQVHGDCGGALWVLTSLNDDRWPGYKYGVCECRMTGTLDAFLPYEKVGRAPPRPELKWSDGKVHM